MGKLIKPDGTTQTVHPTDGKAFTLEEMREYIEGYIEAVPYTKDHVMYINDDSFEKLPCNELASALLHTHRPERVGTRLYGNVLVASLVETGDVRSTLSVKTKQVNRACEDCGKVPSLEWNLYGMTGTLCRDCLAKVVDDINQSLPMGDD